MLKKLPLDPVRPVRVFAPAPRTQAGDYPSPPRNISGKAPFAGSGEKFTIFSNQSVAMGLEVP